MSQKQPLLLLQNVEGRNCIRYPAIEIAEGSVTFISGESGSGKSTLFQICNGTLTPSKGELFFDGKNFEEHDPLYIRQNILLAPQSVFLFSESIEENFRIFYDYRDKTQPNQEKMIQFLSLCQINHPLSSLCHKLSGGERQRVFLAICLSFMPKILMLDEPTAALDHERAMELMKNMCTFAKERGMSLMVISHNQELFHFAKQVIYLKPLSSASKSVSKKEESNASN